MNILNSKKHTSPFRFFIAVNRKLLVWIIFNAIFYSLGSISILVAIYYLGRVVDLVTLGAGGPIQTFLIFMVLGVLGYEVSYRLGHICEIVVISRIRNNTKKALFDHTSSLSFGYFADRFAGEIAHKVSTTADAFERITLIVTNQFIEGIVLIFLSVIALGSIHEEYTIFLVIYWIILLVGSFLLGLKLHQAAGDYAKIEAKTTGAIVDVYSNIGVVKVYGKEENLKKAHVQIDAETKAFQTLGKWEVLTFHFQGLSIVFLTAGLTLITSTLYGSALVTIGEIVFISTLVLRLLEVIWQLGKNFADFIRFRGEAVQNLKDLVVAPVIVDGDHVVLHKEKKAQVEYRNVTFSYIHERPVLSNFSMTIKPGEKVGIVGLSGSGKTTFVNLLLRFFDPQSGSIFLNGKNIKEFTQESLRSYVSHIAQDTSLFHSTVADNIAYGSVGASREDIEKAAKLAYVDEFIKTLPSGYESVVGERGIKLSGGQRQRVAIARALLADRPLFLLDEATSALDSDSENKIQKGLVALMENKTVIAIAHRLSTLSHMDRIVFFENGNIIESGTHDELLRLNGKYAKLWHMQAGGFLPISIGK